MDGLHQELVFLVSFLDVIRLFLVGKMITWHGIVAKLYGYYGNRCLGAEG